MGDKLLSYPYLTRQGFEMHPLWQLQATTLPVNMLFEYAVVFRLKSMGDPQISHSSSSFAAAS